MEENKKKVFLALEVPDSVRQEAFELKNRYHNFPVRWTQDKDLHITVIPPWIEENLPALFEKLESIEGKVGRVSVFFDIVSYGPNNFSPRLIWTTGDVPQKLIDLRILLKETLGIENLRNGFFTHLTLARFDNAEIDRMPLRKLREEVSWSGTAEKLILIETKPGDGGPAYEILKEIKL